MLCDREQVACFSYKSYCGLVAMEYSYSFPANAKSTSMAAPPKPGTESQVEQDPESPLSFLVPCGTRQGSQPAEEQLLGHMQTSEWVCAEPKKKPR